jgi:hydrogenase/urease accessory protein HupE
MESMRFIRVLLSLLLVFSCGSGFAHQTKLSSSLLKIDGSSVRGEVEVNVLDLEAALDTILFNRDTSLDLEAIELRSDAIFNYVAINNRLYCDSVAQVPTKFGDFRFDGEHLIIGLDWLCGGTALPTRYSVSLFQEVDTQSRHVVSVSGDQSFVELLSADNQQVSLLTQKHSWWDLVLKFIISGFEHIAIGFDHIAFLIAVIVLGRTFWPLFKVITAFTIAHSITLTLAVLNVVTIPTTVIEPLIALSIVYVAMENFFVADIKRRYWLTFIFGLIHGFGFASVLRDFGLPQDGLIWALASFNVGVEIGQLVIVLVSVICWRLMTALPFFVSTDQGLLRQRNVSLIISSLVGLLGCGWFIERVFL